MGYSEDKVDFLVDCYNRRQPVPENVHGIYKNIFLKYACIGGFPRVVKKYMESQRIVDAYRLLSSIVFDTKTDFGRRKDRKGEPVFNASEVSGIQSVYVIIPTFLSRDNKRFIVSKVSGGYYARNDTLVSLRQAHIVSKVCNVSIPSLPLAGERIEPQFKLYPEDRDRYRGSPEQRRPRL